MGDRQERLRAKIDALKQSVSPPPRAGIGSPLSYDDESVVHRFSVERRHRAASVGATVTSSDWLSRVVQAAAGRKRTLAPGSASPQLPLSTDLRKSPSIQDRASPYRPSNIPKSVSSGDHDKSSLVLHAAAVGDVVKLRTILDASPELVAAVQDGWTALHFACACSTGLEAVRVLLSAGAAVDAVTVLGVTPLHVASSCGNTSIVRELLRSGASPKAVDQYGASALHCAASSGSIVCALTVIFATDSPAPQDAAGRRPFEITGAHHMANVLRCFSSDKPAPPCDVPAFDALTSGSAAVVIMGDAMRGMGKVNAAAVLYRTILSHTQDQEDVIHEDNAEDGDSVPGAHWGLACCALWNGDWNQALRSVRHIFSSNRYAAFGWCVQGGAAMLAGNVGEAERLFSASYREFCRLYSSANVCATAVALGVCCALLASDQIAGAQGVLEKVIQIVSAYSPSLESVSSSSCTDETVVVLACVAGATDALGTAVLELARQGQPQVALKCMAHGLNARNASTSSAAYDSYQLLLSMLRMTGHSGAAQVVEQEYNARFYDSIAPTKYQSSKPRTRTR